MAETIITFVLEKITSAAVKEILHLWGVGDQVEKVKRELVWIQAFLKDADRKQIVDEIQKQWVRDVREVGCWIEDVIDTFLCEVPQEKPKSGKREAVKRFFGKTKKLPVIHKLGDEINQILARIEEIKERKVRFGINSLGEGSEGKRLPVRPLILPDIEDLDVIGLDTDKDNIVKELLDENTLRRSVVSIVGQGGLGKTTLAKKVYNSNEVKRAFDIRIWANVSQKFELINVVKKIRDKIREIDEREQQKDEEYFLTNLFQSLEGIRYLIVFDDVWSADLWMSIEKALPNKNNGSRILMTTRIHEVVKEADPASEPYKLNFLSKESSLELLLKKAIPSQDIQNECSDYGQLLDLAKQFFKKCGGLPLALVVLGSLLAKKQRTHYAWSNVLETMNWHANEQKRCMEIISTSYDDLPLALKSCFMYFAAFPEDFEIDARSLLQMWVAEGFIPKEENRTLEDTAKSFLEDLVERSMVQVSLRSLLHDDSITSCRIHDLLRDIAIEKAKEDNFLTVCSTPEDLQSCGRARRIAVHNVDCTELMNYVSPNLRTLLYYRTILPNCSGPRLLKVLNKMTQHPYGSAYVMANEQLSQLRWIEYLPQLRYINSIKWNQKSFDIFISTVKFLQTLDLEYMGGSELDIPDCIWHIKTLRHVHLSSSSNISGPPPGTEMPNLQTLWNVKSHGSWDYTNLPSLPNLRDLVITITEGFPWGLIVAFLHTLRKLVSLNIEGRDIPEEVVDMRKFVFYQHLSSLVYTGRLSIGCNSLDVTMFPTHLMSLQLYGSDLQQDPMSALEKLQGLRSLTLIKATSCHSMKCLAGGFPHLQELIIWELTEMERWEIEEGAMPMLKDLHVNCPKIQVSHGLQHLATLKKLYWSSNVKDEPGPSKAKQIRNLCKHVPSITIPGFLENSDSD